MLTRNRSKSKNPFGLKLIKFKQHKPDSIQMDYYLYYNLSNNKAVLNSVFTHDKVYVTNLFVKQQFRKNKLGTILLHELIKDVKENNMKSIELDDMTNIQGDENIYHKVGFRYVTNSSDGPEMIYKI
jgi:ribosomal protein S18 acetylase RimI-like enzyme